MFLIFWRQNIIRIFTSRNDARKINENLIYFVSIIGEKFQFPPNKYVIKMMPSSKWDELLPSADGCRQANRQNENWNRNKNVIIFHFSFNWIEKFAVSPLSLARRVVDFSKRINKMLAMKRKRPKSNWKSMPNRVPNCLHFQFAVSLERRQWHIIDEDDFEGDEATEKRRVQILKLSK